MISKNLGVEVRLAYGMRASLTPFRTKGSIMLSAHSQVI